MTTALHRTVVIAGILCAVAAPATARELSTYPALVDALMSGQSVMTVLDLRQCTRDGTDAPGPKIQGGSHITSFLIPNGQYVAFADTHQTLDGEDRPVTEYIRYRAMPDGNITVRTSALAGSDKQATQRGQYHCKLTRGIRFLAGEPASLALGTRIGASVEVPVNNRHDNAQQAGNGRDPDQQVQFDDRQGVR